ncbi:response regulator transcription factor [Nocardia transvalensis]|uniref:Rv3143 family two-component system response regulator n=1 Tax=Nocardia transvalensis TaxID=37333 RepID=UPI00189410E9|nr:response regulator transcription factor [Nocardia transvalensis]MBF6328157.1 response regulator transcription factor [Nocardia transvalensis]
MRNVADANRPAVVRVLVYSSDSDTRRQVMLALGKHPHPELPPFEYLEVATAPVVVEQLDAGGIDLAILDGEAAPTGGLGLAKQVKDEVAAPPPIVVLTGRADDAWLANWSRAEASVSHPIDPFELTEAVTTALRSRSAA